jgi:glutamate synthase domain-containing protein 2
MVRIGFFVFSALGVAILTIAHIYNIHFPIIWLFVLAFFALGIYDMYFTPHNVLRNYPVIGHFRYMLEFIRPEIQQYFVATNLSGRPFNRETRSLVYQRAKNTVDTLPFGTQHDITDNGYIFAYHSLSPTVLSEQDGRVTVGNQQCKQPYDASRLNISAMSFGALSANAILAMNKGARLGHFAHNTGEGGLSDHHLAGGGDIIWQIGTGYFGCRDTHGNFDPVQFKEKANFDAVKMIEIKLSQGAKPSHGGILPGAKVSAEIASMRGVPEGEDCISPPAHTAFDSPTGLLEYVVQLRELCGGKPVGFKICIGRRSEFMGICKAMLETGIYPDFITVDGAEGGTGAAPIEFTNRLGTPINEAIAFVHSCLLGIGLREHIRIIASGKVVTGFDLVTKLALGADMCNQAREMMFAVGCIQALRCNTNTCPTGVATQDKKRMRAVEVEHKKFHVRNYHDATVRSFLDLVGAMGYDAIDDLTPGSVYRRMSDEAAVSFQDVYPYLQKEDLLQSGIDPAYKDDWAKASADKF